MDCEQARAVLEDRPRGADSAERQLAERHAAHCPECRAVAEALSALRAEAARPVPGPTPQAFERAMAAALRAPLARVRHRPGFLSGAAVGAALAAAIALAVVAIWPAAPTFDRPGTATPTVELALAEVGHVTLAVYSEHALADAEIQVTVSGGIGIDGYGDERELSWRTALASGVNELTLPIVALGREGGQIMVAVRGGGQAKSFLVDVRATDGPDSVDVGSQG